MPLESDLAEPGLRLKLEEYDPGRVARLCLDNPRKLNTLTPSIIADLQSTFAAIGEDQKLRAVVLEGAGDRAFSAGVDINAMQALSPESARAFITSLHEAIDAVRRCPVPVIAAMRGYCFGGALELAAGCDMRIGDDTVVIGMPEVKVGIPSVIEAALLPGLIGWGKAREMILLGCTYSADEALEMGLLQKLAPAAGMDTALDSWLAEILANGPLAMRSQKALLGEWVQLDLADAIQAGIDHFAAAYETDEPRAMMEHHLGKRKQR